MQRQTDYLVLLIAGMFSGLLYFAAFAGAQYCTTENNCSLTDCPVSCSSVDVALKVGLSGLVIVGAAGFFVLRKWPLLKTVATVETVVFLVAAAWILELATR